MKRSSAVSTGMSPENRTDRHHGIGSQKKVHQKDRSVSATTGLLQLCCRQRIETSARTETSDGARGFGCTAGCGAGAWERRFSLHQTSVAAEFGCFSRGRLELLPLESSGFRRNHARDQRVINPC